VQPGRVGVSRQGVEQEDGVRFVRRQAPVGFVGHGHGAQGLARGQDQRVPLPERERPGFDHAQRRARRGVGHQAPFRAWSMSARMSSMCSRPMERRTKVRRHARGFLLLGGQLGVGRRGRVDGQRFRVADVGQMGQKLQPVDKLGAGLFAALDAEAQDGPAPLGKYFFTRACSGLSARPG
jgi:hypothetical protein